MFSPSARPVRTTEGISSSHPSLAHSAILVGTVINENWEPWWSGTAFIMKTQCVWSMTSCRVVLEDAGPCLGIICERCLHFLPSHVLWNSPFWFSTKSSATLLRKLAVVSPFSSSSTAFVSDAHFYLLKVVSKLLASLKPFSWFSCQLIGHNCSAVFDCTTSSISHFFSISRFFYMSSFHLMAFTPTVC